jgi:hypothetical protein
LATLAAVCSVVATLENRLLSSFVCLDLVSEVKERRALVVSLLLMARAGDHANDVRFHGDESLGS